MCQTNTITPYRHLSIGLKKCYKNKYVSKIEGFAIFNLIQT